jgi:hypothetical protein
VNDELLEIASAIGQRLQAGDLPEQDDNGFYLIEDKVREDRKKGSY